MLHLAVLANKVDLVYRLILYGIDPNITNAEGKTPLYYSIKQQNEHIISALIYNGADINHKDIHGNTLLSQFLCENCIYWISPDIINLCLRYGFDPKIKNSSGFILLYYLIYSGDIKNLELMMQKSPDINANERYEGLPTALEFAIQRNDMAMIAIFLKNISDVSNIYIECDTLLEWAVKNSNIEIIFLLISRGADINQYKNIIVDIFMSKRGIEELSDILKGNNDPEIIAYVIKKGSGYLWDCEGHWQIVKSIVDSLPEKNRVDIIYDAVNLIDSTSRKSRLINMLSDKEKADLNNKISPVDEVVRFIDLYGGIEPRKSFVEAENERRSAAKSMQYMAL